MSSSHLFLGLPIDLLVLYFELSSRFHSAAFINHLSLGDVAILIASLHFIFFESCSSILSSHFSHFFKEGFHRSVSSNRLQTQTEASRHVNNFRCNLPEKKNLIIALSQLDCFVTNS